MQVILSIYKDGKQIYIENLEKQGDGFLLDLSDEFIDMLEPGDYTGKVKIKKGKETRTKSFPIKISND